MTGMLRAGSAVAALCLLGACGGGGGGSGGAPLGNRPTSGYTPGVFQPSSTYVNRCAVPRSGIDPISGQPYPDVLGSSTSEKLFLRSWTNELYLWYREVPDLDPAAFTVDGYFDQLRTNASTISGQPKDKFHFSLDTSVWESFAQSGVLAGYGAQLSILAATPPRKVVIAYTEVGSPAQTAGLSRGMEVLRADGADVVNGNTNAAVDTINAALFPTAAGETHTFVMEELSGAQRTVTLVSANVTSAPVRAVQTIATPSGPVGYLLFNDHIATSEQALIDAISTLRDQAIQDLVLDVRCNGGGFLDIASELAYMIGGTVTIGSTFERLVFNDKHPSTNPVTGEPLTPTPFHQTALGFSAPQGTPLPTLNLSRVYVITGGDTCSASESIINGLRGVDVAVYQIGSTSCGKPYGFYPQDNCGTTYFSIQFKGVNAKDFGDYSDGFSPQNTSSVAGERLPGCSVADDFTHELGSGLERRLEAALAFRASNNLTCPAASGFAPGGSLKADRPLSAAEGILPRSPVRENRILRRP